MNILQIHNYYTEKGGGEDQVVHAEAGLLESRGHTVVRFSADNIDVGLLSKSRVAVEAIWSRKTYAKLCEELRGGKIDVVHMHNTFLRISPSAYRACMKMEVPVVQTVHNYRMVCPAATLYRGSRTCTDCVGKPFAWRGIVHRCYRNSVTESALSATVYGLHRALQTWDKGVTLYVAPSVFVKDKLVASGIDSTKIVIKPHFSESPSTVTTQKLSRDRLLFAGRLSFEKGVEVLLSACELEPDIPVDIVGDGPLRKRVKETLVSKKLVNVHYRGFIPQNELMMLMQSARALVVPSIVFETFGKVVVECAALGVPAIVPDKGALAELVQHERTGLVFKSGDALALAKTMKWGCNHPAEMTAMGHAAQKVWQESSTPEKNYRDLVSIYERAMHLQRDSSGGVRG